MKNISFSIMQLIEESQSSIERFITLNGSTFKGLKSSISITIDDIYYDVEIEQQSNYIWFYFNYGSPKPRDDQSYKYKNPKKSR